ncbi:translocon subunit Sec61 [Schizosaccharomyces cryophilus OY26]|uniref:Translocon subunit Sec61 n=1 Tax=Schizosaccharomyces cryophilus (strain OY26 / ATCC MYA-4695 / CBS 11777 / NBRC 106824 / NRRL Y48691) TaxID=653667 RepID=S9W2U3_SCHCR|nr:translocon subunit Sec61 [Schizosaccharomyces cryophilus OY26]EPY52864.1 translocon subunit Sec61 [Schizosaccharomyces cryophilus OY26]
MSRSRLLNTMKPLSALLPEVEGPQTRYQLIEKLGWMAGCVVVYQVLLNMPVYGAAKRDFVDPINVWRVLDGSSASGALVTGLAPIFLSGFLMQLLAAGRKIAVNFNLISDRVMFQNTQKVFSGFLYLLLSIAYVVSGYYGHVSELGITLSLIFVVQLFIPGIICIYLCELVEKGYGLGSGPVLLLSSHIVSSLFWQILSFNRYQLTEDISQYEGTLVGFVFSLFSYKEKFYALRSIFFRTERLNFFSLLACVGAFVGFIYLLCMRIDISIRSSRVRGFRQNFPLRLLYTSASPFLCIYSVVSHLLVLAFFIHSMFPNSVFTRFLVQYTEYETDPIRQLRLTGGLIYYFVPPLSLWETITCPIHTIVYAVFLYSTSVYLSLAWMNATGSGPRDILAFFKENQLIIAGFREVSMLKELEKIVPSAARISALVMSSLSLLAGITASTFGLGVVIASAIVFASFEVIMGANPSLANGL